MTIGDADEDVTATNTRVTLNRSEAIELRKVWEDDGDALGVRPNSIEVKLLAKSGEGDFADTGLTETRTEDGTNHINGTITEVGGTKLAKYDLTGEEYSYKFVETKIGGQPLTNGAAHGYKNTDTTVNGKITTITNEIVLTSVTVTKSWNDAWGGKQNYFGLRPDVDAFKGWIKLYVSADDGETWEPYKATANVEANKDNSAYNVS